MRIWFMLIFARPKKRTSQGLGICTYMDSAVKIFTVHKKQDHTEQAHIVDYTQLHSTRPKSITNEDTKENNPHWLPFMFYPSTQSDFLVESQEAKEK